MNSQIRNFLDQFKCKISKDDILTQGAALSLYTVLALPPLVILLLKFFTSLRLSLQEPLIDQVRQLMGDDAGDVFETVVFNSIQYSENHADLWGFSILFVSASVIFAQLQSSLNLIFESSTPSQTNINFKEYIQKFLTRRIVCFGMVLTFIFISIVSLVVSGMLSLMVQGDFKFWMKIIQNFGNLAVYAFLFTLILHWMPDRKVPWRASVQGGALIALLFVIGKVLIGLYIGQAGIGSAYGATGSLMVLLVWVYYSSIIVLLGAEIASILCRQSEKCT